MLEFLKARALGQVPTGAKFIREFINDDPNYHHDSKLSLCTMTALVNVLMKMNKVNEDDNSNLNVVSNMKEEELKQNELKQQTKKINIIQAKLGASDVGNDELDSQIRKNSMNSYAKYIKKMPHTPVGKSTI